MYVCVCECVLVVFWPNMPSNWCKTSCCWCCSSDDVVGAFGVAFKKFAFRTRFRRVSSCREVAVVVAGVVVGVVSQ